MAIISSEVASLSPSGSRVYVVYRFTDHVAGTHDVNRLVPATTDHAQALIDLTPIVALRIIEQEVNTAQARVEAGEDSLVVVDNPVHSTSKRLAKALLFWMMRERDPYIVLLLESLILDIRATYTLQQVANFLDLTSEQVTRLNTRIDQILNNKADLLAFRDNSENFGVG